MYIKNKPENIILFCNYDVNYIIDLSNIKAISNVRHTNQSGYHFTIQYLDATSSTTIYYKPTIADNKLENLKIMQLDVDFLLLKLQNYYNIKKYEAKNI